MRSKTSTPKRRSQQDKENRPETEAEPQTDWDDSPGEANAVKAAINGLGFPSTPAARIALEDLIANTEDAFNCPPPAATPGDHVHWHNGPTSSDVSASLTQKSRKRARSSSPASSQLERSAHFEEQTDLSDEARPPKILRTPNNDPTQELWNRYMNANGSRNVNLEPPPSFAHLPPSSPMTPSTTSKDSGLRRTVSCGVEWPTSKPKRRRTDLIDSHNRTKNIFAASRREILAREASKSSRVSLLVEKIQESLARQAHAEDEPSSSSPLPEKHSQMPPSQVSPTRSPSRLKVASQHKDQPPAASRKDEREDMLDEFDDDGLDMMFFEQVEKGLSQVSVSRPNPISAAQSDTLQQVVPQSKEPPCRGQASFDENAVNYESALDVMEFDVFDEDDDTFTTELENLAAKVDSQGPDVLSKAPAPPMEALRPLSAIEELDGVFDDGGDDDDLLLQIAEDVDHGRPGIGSTSQVRSIN